MTFLIFSGREFTYKKRQTRKEKFLGRMAKLMPWKRFQVIIELYYPKLAIIAGPIYKKLCCVFICLQNLYNLSGKAMEDALYEIASICRPLSKSSDSR